MQQSTGFVTLDDLKTDLDGHVTIRENKHKKRKAQRASNLYSPHPRQGVG